MQIEKLRNEALSMTVAELAKKYCLSYDKMRWLLVKDKIKAVKKDCKGKNNSNYRHGLNRTRIHHIYLDMKQRCYNPKNHAYRNYGARGIKLCTEWYDDFMSFFTWSMSHGYADNLTIARIDVNKGYSPDNCRWISLTEQQTNRRTTRLITYRGKTQSLKDWAIEKNMNYDKLRWRLDNWENLDKVFGD